MSDTEIKNYKSEWIRKKRFIKKYGIPEELFNKLEDKQKGKCKICTGLTGEFKYKSINTKDMLLCCNCYGATEALTNIKAKKNLKKLNFNL